MNFAESVRQIPRSALILSDTDAQRERRSRFEKIALKELGNSLKTTGQINPIVVRPAPTDARKFEIVAGERRYIAAGLVDLDTVLCSVRDLTDQQVLEVQLIENLQREDLHPLAEAEAYEGLKALGMAVADIAAKTHRDISYIAKTMRLLALGKPARKAFYDGKISKEIAKILARIPVPKLQDEALEFYLDEIEYNQTTAEEFRAQVERKFMTRLDQAPFDVADADLVKSAGACGNCQKNTASQGALFDDIKGKAHCTDTVCFQSKKTAHSVRLLAKAKATGREVITGDQAKRIAQHGETDLQGFVKLSGHAYGKPVKKLVPKDYEPKLLQLPESGQVIEVVPMAALQKPVGVKQTGEHETMHQQQQRAADRKHRAQIAYRVALFKAIFAASGKLKDLVREDYNQIADRLFERLDHDSKKRLWSALDWEVKKKGHSTDFAMPTPIEKMQLEQLLGFIRACSLAHELQVWQHSRDSDKPKDMEAAARMLGIDAGRIRRELEAAAKAKAKPKKKAGKK